MNEQNRNTFLQVVQSNLDMFKNRVIIAAEDKALTVKHSIMTDDEVRLLAVKLVRRHMAKELTEYLEV